MPLRRPGEPRKGGITAFPVYFYGWGCYGAENGFPGPGTVRAHPPGRVALLSHSERYLAFRAGLAQVQLARLRLAEPDNVFGDRPEEPVFWAWAILTPIYQRLRRARRLLSLRTVQDERMDRIPCSGIQEPQGLTD